MKTLLCCGLWGLEQMVEGYFLPKLGMGVQQCGLSAPGR